MATKLKNLRISKVDFVDEGANPDAHIKLTKSKGEKGQSTGENGDKNGFVSRLSGCRSGACVLVRREVGWRPKDYFAESR